MTDEVKNELKKSFLESIVKGGPTMVMMACFCWFLYNQNLHYMQRSEARQIELERQLKDCHESQIRLLTAQRQID